MGVEPFVQKARNTVSKHTWILMLHLQWLYQKFPADRANKHWGVVRGDSLCQNAIMMARSEKT